MNLIINLALMYEKIELALELIISVIALFIVPLFIAVINANYKEEQQEEQNK